jgi:hypothetical protein
VNQIPVSPVAVLLLVTLLNFSDFHQLKLAFRDISRWVWSRFWRKFIMSQPGLLSWRRKIGFGVVISVISSVVMAAIGASPAYAVPDRTNEFSYTVSVIDTTLNPQAVTATAAMGTKSVGVVIAPVQTPSACDLKITKSMSPNPLVSGQPATVTLTAANVGTGPCPARVPFPFPPPAFWGGTSLVDLKQPGLTFTSPPVATPAAGWSCSLTNGNASCLYPLALPAGYTVTFTINATVTALPNTTVTNCAQIGNVFETGPTTNNESCVARTVAAPPPVCDLKITKSMSPNPLVSGQPATVTLTVVHVGTGPCPARTSSNPFGGATMIDNKRRG